MKHFTSYDLALWAALPMAQPRSLETRLRALLSERRCRTLTRRGSLAAAGLALALVGAVSAGHLASEAATGLPVGEQTGKAGAIVAGPSNPQATLPSGVTVTLDGVTDTQNPNAGWWAADGSAGMSVLPANTLKYADLPAKGRGRAFAVGMTYAAAAQPQAVWAAPPTGAIATPAAAGQYLKRGPGVYARVPNLTWSVSPDEHLGNLDHYQPEGSRGTARIAQLSIFAATFGAGVTQGTVRAGIAAGPWTETVDCPKTTGKVFLNTPSGKVIFTLYPNPHHLPPAQAARGSARFMVSDYFHAPSPQPVENDLQAVQRAGENWERAVYALDAQGRIVSELRGGVLTWPDGTDPFGAAKASEIKTMQSATIPDSLLKRVAKFRLVARPYQWVEFKDVALRPVQAAP